VSAYLVQTGPAATQPSFLLPLSRLFVVVHSDGNWPLVRTMSSAPPVSTIVDDQTPPSPLVPPTQPFVEHSTSSAPPRSVQDVSVSARTSFTRVDIEEDGEQRSRAPNPLSGDPLTVPGPAPLSVAVLPIQHEVSEQPSTTSQDALQGEAVTTSLGEDLVPQTPQTYLTFLLISGRKRTMAFEPATAIGRVKELVWNSWPAGTLFLLQNAR